MAERQAAAGVRGRTKQKLLTRIMDAAEREFAEAGFSGASMARIAAAAALPKANILYYFGTKQALYREVLERILALWLTATDEFLPDAAPATAFTRYIEAKMLYSAQRPFASRVFANEVLHGAPHLRPHFAGPMKALIDGKSLVIQGWMDAGLMDRVDPRHLFFAIWAMTQTYADFAAQIGPVLNVADDDAAAQRDGAALILRLVLKGIGLEPPR